jgi:hypothetical protein
MPMSVQSTAVVRDALGQGTFLWVHRLSICVQVQGGMIG